jgi:predicted amidohydrolase YtcJ
VPADLVFLDGPVFTGLRPRAAARAVAVEAGRVVAVGAESAVAGWVGPDTEVVDLAGRMLLPGFQDAHVHPATGGLTRLRCDLEEVTGPGAAAERISAYAAEHPEVPWVRGGGWSYAWFPGGTPPAGLLDRLVPDRPCYLRVRDGHSAWVNHRALAAAGIDASSPDPPDGRIERLPDGSPQGTLHEGAMALVERVMPATTPAELEAALLEGQRYLLSLGVTAWQDAWVEPDLHRAYRALAADGRLAAAVRGALWWDREAGLEQIEGLLERRAEGVGGYVPGTVKLMLDGVVENFTAALLDPYLGADGAPTANRGIDMVDPGRLTAAVTALDAAGFQCHFHAIGDGAVRLALDAVEAARAANGWNDLRHHISHLQVVHPADLPRFRRLGVAATAQPLWACNEPAMTELTIPFLGRERARRQYPFGSLLAQGVVLAMGSDWSVTTPHVMRQVSVAVTRLVPGEAASAPFLPEERIDLTAALHAFTAGSAYVNHLDADRGVIEAGAVADLVVLDRDPFEAERLWEVEVDLTVVGGEVVFRR